MKRLALAVALLIALAVPAWADFQAGADAYARGDYATALHELKPLAEQGNSDAQAFLGLMYRDGRGIPQNYAEAVKWYRKAAEQGEATTLEGRRTIAMAQLMIGTMYLYGWGAPQNYVRAHMWFDLAASRSAHVFFRVEALKNRERAAAKMTPAQIAEAQRLAREWQPKK